MYIMGNWYVAFFEYEKWKRPGSTGDIQHSGQEARYCSLLTDAEEAR